MKKPKFTPTEYSVADAVENGVNDLTALRDELQEWYDNLPENFQSGEKGSQLEEAISELDDADGFDNAALVDASDSSGEPAAPSSLRFTFNASNKRRQSRADRCNEATSLLRQALDVTREWLAGATTNDEGETDRDPDGDVASACDELENLLDRAEGVSFPGMYG